MFFHLELERTMRLHPRHFGPRMRDVLTQNLVTEVEGTCAGKKGFVVAVTEVTNPGAGELKDSSGYASFKMKYRAIVFRPFKGEVLDCIVTQVNKMGFFAEAGPLQVFVSNHLMQDNMKFSGEEEPCYVAEDESQRLQKDSMVRLRVVGTRIDATEIFCIGSIKDDWLGII
eukprot:jgi/Chlat1/5878/Chrsp4S06389